MNELIKQVTPLTRGIIWLIKDESTTNPYYAQIDYLLDGLLTANLTITPDLSSRLIIGQNFTKSLYVMVIKEVRPKEIESFVSLIKNELGPENDITVIDEWNGSEILRPILKEIGHHLRLI